MLPDDAPRFGRYQLGARLGGGGYGEVWKAWDPGIKRWVAIKILQKDGSSDSARFLREARAAATLEHPNIVQVYETGEQGDAAFIAMAFVAGGTLASRKGADPRDLARILRDVARAVQAAHDKGIIHRDLKPENILLDGDRPLVADFGLAKLMNVQSSISGTGVAIGTPAYMAPEQAAGGNVDARTDVYGLGATLYAVLTAELPFQGTNAYEVLSNVLSADVREPRLVRPGVPAELEAVVLRCLEKEPAARYASADEVADDLDRFLRGEPVRAKPRTSLSRMGRTLSRRPLAVTGVITVLVAIVGAVLLLGRTERRAEEALGTLLDRLRTTAKTCHDAALDRRRGGDIAGMRAEARRLEAVAQEAVRRMPDEAEPHYLLGKLYRVMLRDADARRELEEARRLNPSHPGVRYELGILYATLYNLRIADLLEEERSTLALSAKGVRGVYDPQARHRVRDRESDELKAATLEILGPLDDGFARALCEWLRGGGDGIDIMKRAFEAMPDRDEVIDWYTAALMNGGHAVPALKILSDGIQRDRGCLMWYDRRVTLRINYLMNRGLSAAHDLEQADACVADIRAALAMDPEAPSRLLQLALLENTRYLLGTPEPEAALGRALEAAERALTLAPGSTAARWSRGQIRANRILQQRRSRMEPNPDDVADCLADFDAAAADRRTATSAMVAKARFLTNEAESIHDSGGDGLPLVDRALEALDQAVRRNPDRPYVWEQRAAVHRAAAIMLDERGRDWRKHQTDAIADAQEAVRISPGRGTANRELALCVLARARREVGIRDVDADYRGAFAVYAELNRGEDRPDLLAEHALALDNYALLLRSRGDDPRPALTEAIRLLEKASTLDRAAVEAWQSQVDIYMALAEADLEARQDPGPTLEAALRAADECVARAPRSAVSWAGRAKTLAGFALLAARQSKDPDEWHEKAERDYARSLELNARRAATYTSRGQARVNWGMADRARGRNPKERYLGAKRDYEQALEINPRWDETWFSLGTVHNNLAAIDPAQAPALYARAIECFDKAIAIRPQVPDHYLRRGQSRVNLAGRRMAANEDPTRLLEDALADYEAAAKLQPRRGEIAMSAGNARGALLLWNLRRALPTDDLFEALSKDFARAIKLDPRDAESHWRRGYFAMAVGRRAEALEDFEAALKIDPSLERRLRPWIEECRK